MPPLATNFSARRRLACARSRVAFSTLEGRHGRAEIGDLVFTSSMACSSLKRLARVWPTRPRTWASADARSVLAAVHRGFLDGHLNLVRLLVELDQQVALFHTVIVVHQHPRHLARHTRSHEGHMAVDIGVIGGNRVQHRLNHGVQEVPSYRHAGDDPMHEQPVSQPMRGRPGCGRFGRRARRIGRRNSRSIG